MTDGISEAEYDQWAAGMFRRPGQQVAVSPQVVSTVESVRGLTDVQRYDIRSARMFGNARTADGIEVTPQLLAALDECDRQERAIPGLTVALSRGQEDEARGLLDELAEAAQSRLVMSPERARLHAQSELLRLQETCGGPDGLLRDLRADVRRLRESRPLTSSGGGGSSGTVRVRESASGGRPVMELAQRRALTQTATFDDRGRPVR